MHKDAELYNRVGRALGLAEAAASAAAPATPAAATPAAVKAAASTRS